MREERKETLQVKQVRGILKREDEIPQTMIKDEKAPQAKEEESPELPKMLIDISILINCLSLVKQWVRERKNEIIIPLEGSNTLKPHERHLAA
jgi:hypothetical protein